MGLFEETLKSEAIFTIAKLIRNKGKGRANLSKEEIKERIEFPYIIEVLEKKTSDEYDVYIDGERKYQITLMRFKERLFKKRINYALLDNENTIIGEVRNGISREDGMKEMILYYKGKELGKVSKRVFAKAWNIHFNGWQMYFHLSGDFEVEGNGEKIIDCNTRFLEGTKTIGYKQKQYEHIALLLLMVQYMDKYNSEITNA